MANIRKPVNATVETKIRTSLFDRRDRLAFKKDPKFYRVWVNDVRNEVQEYLDSGFTFVSEDARWGRTDEKAIDAGTPLDSRAAVNVGRAGGLENVTAFLMQIPIDDWEELRKPAIEAAQFPTKEVLRQAEQLKQSDNFYGSINIK